MDILTHALSGVLLANSIPEATLEQKIAIVIGTVLPDIPFARAYFLIAKMAKKSLFSLNLNDFTSHGKFVKPKLKTYLFFHSFLILPLLFVLGFLFNDSFVFLAFGWILHLVYDLFFHKYEEEELRPKPFYPSKISFNFGLTNGWRFKKSHFIIMWLIHLFLILLITL